jgi:hypothetical protein
MPTKTDRILSYLPGTFRTSPRPTALYAVVDAFGSELLKAENSLAALMLAHWVDHADEGAEFISDLACIAALYGLAPRVSVNQKSQSQGQQNGPSASKDGPPCPPQIDADETVEEFREHLKRYVRTFLDGTVTVQGILRITAEALGLHIADEYSQLNTWWKRPSPELVTSESRPEDAAELLFGSAIATQTGTPALPAQIVGKVDLSKPVDLREAPKLRVKVDGAAAIDVDCTKGGDASAMKVRDIVSAINEQVVSPIATTTNDGRFLTLASPTTGATSQLEIQEVDGDAALLLLGLLPFTYHGTEATHASVTSLVDLHDGVDLSENHYLRLQIDEQHLAEIDCAGQSANATTLEEIKHAINAALGIDVASHDDHYLTLTSQTTGSSSRIILLPAAAQDAREAFFSSAEAFYAGVDARAASLTGINDLSRGVDLSMRDRLRIQMNNQPPVTIDCTGNDPAHTLPSEIVAILNTKLGAGTASHDGHFIHLVSPTSGPDSTIVFESLPDEEDATELIFGIIPRVFHGAASTNARLIGKPDLSGGADLRARHIIQVTLDSGTPIEVDARSTVNLQDGTSKLSAVTLEDIVRAFKAAFRLDIASDDGQHLILVSPTAGGASRIDLGPLQRTNRRRFVTRAFVTDEAAYTIFGFLARSAQGTAATQARVIGTVDLSRGVDLREKRFLRIGIDGQPPIDIDCSNKSLRPRASTLEDIFTSINEKIKLTPAIASSDGKHLVLTAPLVGDNSAITFEPSRGADAMDKLLGREPDTFRGQDATRVSFVSTVDGKPGINLKSASHVKISIDGAEAKEIDCAGFDTANTTLQQIVIAINVAFSDLGGSVATQDGTHIFLTSPTAGSNSQIEFLTPTKPDATKDIFGVSARKYHGVDATSAQVTGVRELELSSKLDLSTTRFLNVTVDGNAPVTVDCAAGQADPSAVPVANVAGIISQQLKNGAVKMVGTHLTIASPITGAATSIQLLPYTGGDAHDTLLGSDVPLETRGQEPTPATITGDVDLLAPVNLEGERILRLAVDGGQPIDFDVAGAAPERTTLDEIVTSLNNTIPGLAAATPDDHLRLSSPTAGESSRLELFPLRTLELIEYPPTQKDETPLSVQHADQWFVVNDSGVDADLKIDLSAPKGASCLSLVNMTSGMRIQLMTSLRTDELVQISRDPVTGIRATITAADGTESPVPGGEILVGPPGSQAWVSFKGNWQLRGGTTDNPATLQLNNPLAPAILVLSSRQPGSGGNNIMVNVTAATLSGVVNEPVIVDGHPVPLKGWIRSDASGYRIVASADPTGAVLAHLRPGRGISLGAYLDHVVFIYGPLYAGDDMPLMIVNRIADLFDVTLKTENEEPEDYYAVTIGTGSDMNFPESLTWQITTKPSLLVRAVELDKGSALVLPRGRSEWVYLDGDGSRFDLAKFQGAKATFEDATFAGKCREQAVFDISRFNNAPPEQEETVFAEARTVDDPTVSLQFHWMRHQPGAFVVNLPADLPERFGSRFDQVRFGMGKDTPETFANVVIEPATDDSFIGKLINEGPAKSNLVVADSVPIVPLGWDPMAIPFYHPRARTLSGGTDSQPAMLFLQEPGMQGFIRLQAREPGAWGNAISITVRKGSNGQPAYFDVTVSYAGVRLENARQTVLGGQQQLPASSDDLLKPGPIGILQAKAAGVQASVTRQRT